MINAQSHEFTVGAIACAVLLDNAKILGRAGFLHRFPEADAAAYEQAFAEIGQSLDSADDSRNILALKIAGETVLVDAGEGALLLESLQLAGLTPETITRVIITHTHGDHVMGLLRDDGAPTFPNATYVISSAELAFWRERIDGGTADHGPILAMMADRGLAEIAMDAEILPGLHAVPAAGHTPGHIALLLESGGEKLIHLADLLHSPVQFRHPEWSARFDVDTRVSVPTRREALERAAQGRMLALFYHLTFPGLGLVTTSPEGFAWTPR